MPRPVIELPPGSERRKAGNGPITRETMRTGKTPRRARDGGMLRSGSRRGTRRAFLRTGTAGAAAVLGLGAEGWNGRGPVVQGGPIRSDRETHEEGRILARPREPRGENALGLQPLGLGGPRDG